MIKVLHIGKFFPPPWGGMERVLADLVEQLAGHVHVDVLVANSGPRRAAVRHHGARVWKVPGFGRIAGTSLCPSMPFVLKRVAADNAYDLIHLHLPNPMAHLATWLARPPVPVVITWHSDIIRQKRLLPLYQPLVDRLVSRAAAIMAATPKHFSSSTQLGACPDAGRRWVVPFGIDSSRFALTAETAARAQRIRRERGQRPLIFAIGRHVEYKGFEHLIRALPDIPDGHLVLGGSGPLTASLKRVARQLGVCDRIDFAGPIPPDWLPAYYHAADVFCLPSVGRNEAFGMVQLEAMACGKPVVCCELHNGVTDVNQHGQTGLVVPPRNAPALAAALGQLLNDSALRQRMGIAAFNRVVREYSFARMREGTLNVYRAVLAGQDTAVSPSLARAA